MLEHIRKNVTMLLLTRHRRVKNLPAQNHLERVFYYLQQEPNKARALALRIYGTS